MGGRHSAGKKERNVISVNDRVSVFLELADAHRLLGEQVKLVVTSKMCRSSAAGQQLSGGTVGIFMCG